MRKIGLLIIYSLLLISSLSADSGDVEDLDDGASTTAEVVIDTSKINLVKLGFSKNEIKDIKDEIIALENEVQDLYFDSEAFSNDEEIYVYWLILSPHMVNASLSIPNALQSDGDRIEWSVKFANKPDVVISSNNESESELCLFPQSKSFGTIGSAELVIETENVSTGDILPGEYKGELRLNIKTE